MNILINLSIQKQGGGQNVGMNFLQVMKETAAVEDKVFLLVSNGSEIHKTVRKLKFDHYYVTAKNPLIRILRDLFIVPNIIARHKIDVVYTYFGYTLLPKRIVQVCGVAFSYLFYPEVNFWIEYTGLSLWKKRLIDAYRSWGIKRSHGLIFENDSMRLRSHELFNIPPIRTVYIKPSNDYINHERNDVNLNPILSSSPPYKILVLCGWQRNKNILRIPEIAHELGKLSDHFEFTITAPPDHSTDHNTFTRHVHSHGVQGMINLIGVVEKAKLPDLYKESTFVLLLSKLESFSNNIIESWVFRRPLIITDAHWSRSLCKEAAYYVNRESPKGIADAIHRLSSNPEMQKSLILKGLKEKDKYPTIVERAQMEFAFLRKIHQDQITV
jgi:glycosyltransferase involved in cell wall biosynthesis